MKEFFSNFVFAFAVSTGMALGVGTVVLVFALITRGLRALTGVPIP